MSGVAEMLGGELKSRRRRHGAHEVMLILRIGKRCS